MATACRGLCVMRSCCAAEAAASKLHSHAPPQAAWLRAGGVQLATCPVLRRRYAPLTFKTLCLEQAVVSLSLSVLVFCAVLKQRLAKRTCDTRGGGAGLRHYCYEEASPKALHLQSLTASDASLLAAQTAGAALQEPCADALRRLSGAQASTSCAAGTRVAATTSGQWCSRRACQQRTRCFSALSLPAEDSAGDAASEAQEQAGHSSPLAGAPAHAQQPPEPGDSPGGQDGRTVSGAVQALTDAGCGTSTAPAEGLGGATTAELEEPPVVRHVRRREASVLPSYAQLEAAADASGGSASYAASSAALSTEEARQARHDPTVPLTQACRPGLDARLLARPQ